MSWGQHRSSRCAPRTTIASRFAGSSLPYALPDKRPLLDQFNDTMAIGADEAPAWSYYWCACLSNKASKAPRTAA